MKKITTISTTQENLEFYRAICSLKNWDLWFLINKFIPQLYGDEEERKLLVYLVKNNFPEAVRLFGRWEMAVARNGFGE